ncbi:MAG: phenylalanine--tRNA ligase subunit beta, partial [Patescibacteria group bacterium]
NSIKRLVPDVDSKTKMVEELTMRAYESEDIVGNTFDSEIPHNRYADSASHLGVAREYSIITGKKLSEPKMASVFPSRPKGLVDIKIVDKDDCPRYGACVFELGERDKTPSWMVQILTDCGLRPINPIVDVLNYVMLEIGQPMHAFDADKLKGAIQVRRAKAGEKITTIDEQDFKLTKDDIVIADSKQAQAIAGIKGGKSAEVSSETKRIVVESANFDQVAIYRTSRRLDLVTDASIRFAHGLSPELVEMGLNRAKVLLEEIAGVKLVDCLDVYPNKQSKKIIGFDVDKFNSLTGLQFKSDEAWEYLKKLGFKKIALKSKSKRDEFMVEVPPLRRDVEIFEDLVEEIVRLYGINDLEAQPPHISIAPAKEQDITLFKDQLRRILTNIGYTEVYNYIFAEKGDELSYEFEKPLAEDKKYLRKSIADNLGKNLKENSKSFKDIRIFEIGSVFDKNIGERFALGIGMKSKPESSFLELKGTVEQLLNGLGLIGYSLVPDKNELIIKVGDKKIGRIWHIGKDGALAELEAEELMELEQGEREYQPISKYPAVMRDISLSLRKEVSVGEILQEIELANVKDVVDVDLIDYYDTKHLTFRIVFQSDERTLKDSEVTEEFNKIVSHLKKKIPFEIR